MHLPPFNTATARLCALLLLGTAAPLAKAVEKSYTAGASVLYKFDDNISLSANDILALQGVITSGFFDGQYRTDRFAATADLALDFDRYFSVSLDSDNPQLIEPDASDFDSDNQDLKGSLAYDWERHQLSLSGRYWRDSTLNTAFLDTGRVGGGRELEGASRRIESSLLPGWRWTLTERQSLDATLQVQQVDYSSDLYIDYRYGSLNVAWLYILNERMTLQLVPNASWYQNEADNRVRSRTGGLQAGFLWAMTEQWQFNLLAGGTHIRTDYGQDGFFTIIDGEIVFIEIQNQNSNSFVGDLKLAWKGERSGFDAGISSRVSPSGNGILQQYHQGRMGVNWEPIERMRLTADGLLGQNTSTDDRIQGGRIFREVGVGLNYRFVRDWWVSGRYRYREQDYESQSQNGRGNALFVTLSYRLPRDIL